MFDNTVDRSPGFFIGNETGFMEGLEVELSGTQREVTEVGLFFSMGPAAGQWPENIR